MNGRRNQRVTNSSDSHRTSIAPRIVSRVPHSLRFSFLQGCGFRRRAPNPFRAAGRPQYVDNTYVQT
jgi:hypothetical protein